MEIPNLVRERLGGESIEATVNLGDEDVICVTPTRTLLYRGDGLLSDESVEEYSHDVERLDLSQGRRNTKFVLEYVDGTEEFKVPNGRADTLLTILLQAVLRVGGVAEEDESVAGVFQFSELTLVVTESRLVKHVGASVWDEDFEVFDYEDVTALDFEEGSVATQLVLTVGGRPQRIKAPNDEAPQVEQTLTQTLCSFYDVNSLEELAATLGGPEDETDASTDASEDRGTSQDIELDDGISPLVGGDDADGTDDAATTDDATGRTDRTASPESADAHPGNPDLGSETTASTDTPGDTQMPDGTQTDRTPEAGAESVASDSAEKSVSAESSTPADTAATAESASATESVDVSGLEAQLEELTEAVKRQNKLLRRHNKRLDDHEGTITSHDEKIDQLIEELRRGR